MNHENSLLPHNLRSLLFQRYPQIAAIRRRLRTTSFGESPLGTDKMPFTGLVLVWPTSEAGHVQKPGRLRRS